MNVFITGATGFIGYAVAQAYRRAGHRVRGLTRSEAKIPLLTRAEIEPIIGSMQEPDSYRKVAEDSDILIHAAADYENDRPVLDEQTVETLIDAGRTSSSSSTFIYTSGVWIQGNTGSEVVNEKTPVNPIEVVTWRPSVEDRVLKAQGVNTIVIRPGWVYGKRGGITGQWFEGATSGDTFKVVGDGSNHWAMVHVDDLADAFVRAGESGLDGEVFLICDDSHLMVREMTSTVARTVGYDREIQYIPFDKAREEMGPIAEAMVLDQKVDSSKAHEVLGWRSRHSGFAGDIDLYYAAWKAWK